MGNRPINRRPWRRPPWRRAAKRPVRWLDANSNRTLEPPWYTAGGPSPLPNQGKVLLWGDDDLEWMDSNEVLLMRLVGSISYGFTVESRPTDTFWGIYGPPVLRAGILVCEELDSQGGRPTLDLFDPEVLEEYEWMWLHQAGEYTAGSQIANGSSVFNAYRTDIPLDLRVRRKLGKKDAVVLYNQWGFPTANAEEPPENNYDVGSFGTTMLRYLVSSK